MQNWKEMVQIDRIHELMKIAKDRAKKAGANTFTRDSKFGRKFLGWSDEMDMAVLSPIASVEDTSVEDMCWKGYSRVKGTSAYSKGSCRRSGGRRKGGRRKRHLKEELKF